jgi:hypothetical protein
LGIVLAVILVDGLLSLLTVESAQLLALATALSYHLVVVASFVIVVINASCHLAYIPLLLSFGETRKNIFLGFHYFRLLIILATIILCALVWALVPGELSAAGLRSIPIIAVALVFFSSLGSIIGTICVKSRLAGGILLGIFGGICGGVSGTVLLNNSTQGAAQMVQSVLSSLNWPLVLTVTAAVFLINVIFQWLLLRRQEVKL